MPAFPRPRSLTEFLYRLLPVDFYARARLLINTNVPRGRDFMHNFHRLCNARIFRQYVSLTAGIIVIARLGHRLEALTRSEVVQGHRVTRGFRFCRHERGWYKKFEKFVELFSEGREACDEDADGKFSGAPD